MPKFPVIFLLVGLAALLSATAAAQTSIFPKPFPAPARSEASASSEIFSPRVDAAFSPISDQRVNEDVLQWPETRLQDKDPVDQSRDSDIDSTNPDDSNAAPILSPQGSTVWTPQRTFLPTLHYLPEDLSPSTAQPSTESSDLASALVPPHIESAPEKRSLPTWRRRDGEEQRRRKLREQALRNHRACSAVALTADSCANHEVAGTAVTPRGLSAAQPQSPHGYALAESP